MLMWIQDYKKKSRNLNKNDINLIINKLFKCNIHQEQLCG